MDVSDPITALVQGACGEPFAVLGIQNERGQRLVRTLQPGAEAVELLDGNDKVVAHMRRVHREGVFEAAMPPRKRLYRFRVHYPFGVTICKHDPYRFPPLLGDLDLYLLGEGSHEDIYTKLGAHPATVQGVAGTWFAVWAPNAARVSVVGDFNDWDGRVHGMRCHRQNGIWELFIPEVTTGALYKFELLDASYRLLPLKSDPVGQFFEPPPANASIVYESAYEWQDEQWMAQRDSTARPDRPVSIYEVHLGSWRKDHTEGRSLGYRALAQELVAYICDMGFTHVELLPITEHPFDGSWGYQPIGIYAPTQRFGTPDDLRYLVDCLHQAGIGVILDWVPAHFPRDEHGLARFDGSALYEHVDRRKGEHADWGTLVFDYGRREVVNYLIGSALCWVKSFHIDALRVDAVASMLYLDYSRAAGEWVPNEQGGNENHDAVAFLRKLNQMLSRRKAASFAEESTTWPGVSRPSEAGGLGFTYKWNMGWMNDTLAYMSEAPEHRRHHHDKMTFGLVYAFSEQFVLPLSHDEVVHGKRSLLGRMPGDEQQRFANLRAYFAFMFAHPGKKLLFMGGEFAQPGEWNHDAFLDWTLLDQPLHHGVLALVRDLNLLYGRQPELHALDCAQEGFEWIDGSDNESSIFSWLRHAPGGGMMMCVSNFLPAMRASIRLGVPVSGQFRLVMNTDAARYAGSDLRMAVTYQADPIPANGKPFSVDLKLPPLATIWLCRDA